MEIIILLAVLVLMVLAGAMFFVLLKKKDSDVLSDSVLDKFNLTFKDSLMLFQSNIQNNLKDTRTEIQRSLGDTRAEVSNSKDIMSQHTVKTLDTVREMGNTIFKIVQQQEEAQKLGQSLKDLLQSPKLRGNYGEVILEEMLDRILPKGIWQKQYPFTGGEHVDAVVKIKEIIIPIDSKFPRDDYQRYMEAPDEGKKLHWKNYEDAVKEQIKSIAKKYVRPEEGTSEFALMFIPSEAIYYETIAEKNYLGTPSTIYEFAEKNHVVLVSPNTFYAFLQIIIIGIRNIDVIKNAKKLQEGLDSLKKSFELFYKKHEDIGKGINNISTAYRIGDDHIKRYQQKLEDTLQLNTSEEKLLEDK